MKAEQRRIEALFRSLIKAPLDSFPESRGHIDAPSAKGVYLIYSPDGEVQHVGSTPRARGGIRQRLKDHMASRSSFTQKHMDGNGAQLRNGYTFRCLPVSKPRHRALVEALAIGRLCPAHIGHGLE